MTDIPPDQGQLPLPLPGGEGQPQQSLTPVADAMQPGVQDATGDFMTTLVRLVESKGLLTEEELILLVEKFEVLEPQVKQQIEQELITQLDPRFVERLRAVQRFVQSRQGNAQQVQQAQPI